jgi:hypothetical protein
MTKSTDVTDVKDDELEIPVGEEPLEVVEEPALYEQTAEIISTTRETIEPELPKYLTQQDIDELSATKEGQSELSKIIGESDVPEAKRLIFAIKDHLLLKQIVDGLVVLENNEYQKMLETTAFIQRVALNADPHVISEEDVCKKKEDSESEAHMNDIYKELEIQGMDRPIRKKLAPLLLELHKAQTHREAKDETEWLFVVGIPLDAMENIFTASYHMFMAPKSYYDEMKLFRELEKFTGRKFLPAITSYPKDLIEDPNMEQVYLAGGYIGLGDDKDENGNPIKTATIITHSMAHFEPCHKVILEKCKKEMMKKLGVDKVEFAYS